MSHQWIRVEFYGAMPTGQIITDVNHQEVARNLAKTFGFVAVDKLLLAAVQQPHPAPGSPGTGDSSWPLAREASSRANEDHER